LTPSFLTGGIFSYDGVHPSSAGYSIVADQFISAINEQVGTDIPRPDLVGILFEPNVPATGGAGVNAGPWGYDFSMWRGALSTSGVTSRGLDLRMPGPASDPRPMHAPTRTLSRT